MSSTNGSALVTGASRGLGAVIAQALARDGWPVAVNYRSDAAAAERVVQAVTAAGGRAAAVRADVTDEEGVRGLVDEVEATLGPVGVVVANATGEQPLVPVEELTWQHHLDQLAYFVKSPTLLVQCALPGMKALGRGRVIQIGSDSFEKAEPRTSAYTAAKGAQLGLAKTWARELGPHGVTSNVVAPGWIPVERHAGIPRGELDHYAGSVPLRRMGTPEDVAAVVAFLASDATAFITGERITVNGGQRID